MRYRDDYEEDYGGYRNRRTPASGSRVPRSGQTAGNPGYGYEEGPSQTQRKAARPQRERRKPSYRDEEDFYDDDLDLIDLDRDGEWEEDDPEYEDEIDRMRRRQASRGYSGQRTPSRRPSGSGNHPQQERGSRRSDGREPYGTRGKKPDRKKKKRGLKILGIAAAVLLLAAGVLFAQRWWKTRDGYWNVAVFGVDSRSGSVEKGALSDVTMICSINKKTNEIRLVSVYRDTYLEIDGDGRYDKINEAYFLGGHEQAVEALERNLNIEIDDYATFNWKAVADAINLLGGIDLEITDKEFKYINSFITETVNSTGVGSYQLDHAGMNHLDGVQAVAYCRLRLMDTDFNRTERQRKVVQLTMEKAKQADLSVLTTIITGVLPQLSTSIGAEDLVPIAKNISKYEIGMTAGFPFAKTTTRIDGKDCVIPMTLESNVAALHQFLYGDTSYQVPNSVKEISAHVSEVSGIYEEGEIPGFVYQGSGSQGSASGQDSPAGSAAQPAAQASTQPQTTAETAAETPEAESSTEETEESETETEESGSPEAEDDTESGEDPETEKPAGEDDGPVSPLAPDSSANHPGNPAGETEAGPGANLPSPDSSGETVGIIHSGNGTSEAPAQTEEIGPGID